MLVMCLTFSALVSLYWANSLQVPLREHLASRFMLALLYSDAWLRSWLSNQPVRACVNGSLTAKYLQHASMQP